MRITNNGVTTVCDITTEQGNYGALKVAGKELAIVDIQAENNMTDRDYPGASAQAILLTLGNVGYVDEEMIVELYHDTTPLSKTKAKAKRLGQAYQGLGVTIIVDGDAEVSGSWETTNIYRENWSLDTAPNKVKITIDGVEQWLDINQIGAYGKLVQFDVFGRSINVSADKTEVEMGEEVTVSVTLNGKILANAVYDLTYETDKFELVSASTGTAANSGRISEMLYKEDGSCYSDGGVIATYTFKALGQTSEVTADFGISATSAATYVESINGTEIETGNNEKVSVTIKLKEYGYSVKVDGETVTGERANVKYTNENHTFEVVSTPAATVTYKVNGTECDSVSIKDVGTYTIEYTIVPELGYKEITGTFTVVIGVPEYVVEVNVTDGADYVSGKKIVLVYTNTDGLAFKYGNDLMIDVTARNYKYNDTDEYRHTYAIVTDVVEGAEFEDYAENVDYVIPSPANLIKLTYSLDINFSGTLTVQDITTAYGIYNVNENYFRHIDYQKQILRADTDGNRKVNNDDTNAVVNAVKGI